MSSIKKKIETLTPEQVAAIPGHVEEWLKHGLSCEPMNAEEAKRGVALAYEAAGLKAPRLYILLRSPLEGAYAAAICSTKWQQVVDQVRQQVWEQVGEQAWDQVRQQVWDQVWDQVSQQVGHQVRGQVWQQVGEQVGQQVVDQVGDQVWEQVGDQAWDQVSQQVWQQVWDQVWQQVGEQVGQQVGQQVSQQVRQQVWQQVWDQVWDQVSQQVSQQVRQQVWQQVGHQVRDQVSQQVGKSIWGQHNAGWLSWAMFHMAIGVEGAAKAHGVAVVAKNAGWWWAFSDLAIITDRPESLSRDASGRLHNENGMAIRYRDGFGVHAWHGVRVPAAVIEHPEKITIEMIEREQNAEVRRVMVERYGPARYIVDSGVKPVHSDDFGTLYIKPEQDGLPAVAVVKVVNSTPESDGSSKDYFLRVHPELRPMIHKGLTWLQGGPDPNCEQPDSGDFVLGRPQALTARNAVASTFGFRGSEYAPCQET